MKTSNKDSELSLALQLFINIATAGIIDSAIIVNDKILTNMRVYEGFFTIISIFSAFL